MLVSTMRPDPDFWRGKRVLLTGHTGFKGAWLALWLQRLGAQVTGVALPPATGPNLFTLAQLGQAGLGLESHFCDIRSPQALAMRDGVITAVGTQAEVMATKTASTQVIDLQGKTLMPGFVGAHEHPTITAVFDGAINLSGFRYKTNAEVWEALRKGVAGVPKGQWIYAGGLDAILTQWKLSLPQQEQARAAKRDKRISLAVVGKNVWETSLLQLSKGGVR